MMRRFSTRAAGGAWLAALLALAGCAGVPQQQDEAPEPGVAAPRVKPARPAPGVPVLPPAGSGRGGYYLDDGPGDNPPPNLAEVPDAEVRIEPIIARANKPYSVFGKSYTPLTDSGTPFVQRGLGTWYGKKFHGQRTSSGELYDMYKMTAAHPTLPIPSYARVTNLDNGRQVVVRINDRGPFHSTRVIDVSYTAALKLGLLGKGSHQLEVERILPKEVERMVAARGGTSAAPSSSVVVLPKKLAVETVEQSALVLHPAPVAARPATNAGSVPVRGAKDVGQVLARPSTESRLVPVRPVADEGLTLAGNAQQQEGAVLPGFGMSAAPVAPAVPVAVKSGFYLQLGAYARAANAEAVRARLAAEGVFDALELVQVGAVFRLFSGPFATRQEALQAVTKLPSALSLKPLVVQR
ncbi:MAG: septal ring lytic transglycosylase RlpA family protein [Pseudomonadota bacterium]